jgi:alkane 1-monooxygenase
LDILLDRLSLLFFSPYLLIATSIIGIANGGIFNWIGFMLLFVLFPTIEFLFHDFKLKAPIQFNFITELWLLISPFILTYFLIWTSQRYLDSKSTMDKLGLIMTVGSLTGAIGITIAHELVHRNKKWQRALGVWNLLLVNFGHWGVEHVFGHHRHIGTPEDHASAIKDQWLYTFWAKNFFGGFRSSYYFEKNRISGKFLYQIRNRILNYTVISIVITFFLSLYEIQLVIFWWAQSLVAIILLLSVDYIEHYGLRRQFKSNDMYEPVKALHSWDTESFITNVLLFKLGFHSHHHLKARVPYQELQSQDNARFMPYGYSAMLVLAFIPPLFFKKMNPLI